MLKSFKTIFLPFTGYFATSSILIGFSFIFPSYLIEFINAGNTSPLIETILVTLTIVILSPILSYPSYVLGLIASSILHSKNIKSLVPWLLSAWAVGAYNSYYIVNMPLLDGPPNSSATLNAFSSLFIVLFFSGTICALFMWRFMNQDKLKESPKKFRLLTNTLFLSIIGFVFVLAIILHNAN